MSSTESEMRQESPNPFVQRFLMNTGARIQADSHKLFSLK